MSERSHGRVTSSPGSCLRSNPSVSSLTACDPSRGRFSRMCRDGHSEIQHATDDERCPVYLERDRAQDLWIALEQAVEAMTAVSVFVSTGERIKQPEGAEFWAGEMRHARDALKRHEKALGMEDKQ